MKPTSVVIVDDHIMFRDGIISILNDQPDFEVVGQAGTVAGTLEAVRDSRPELILMDYSLPDGNGLDATREILASYPQTQIVLLTVHEEDDLLFEAVRRGAKGYLLKNISAKEMLAKLRGLSQGEAAILPAQTRRILAEFARTEPPEPTERKEMIPLTDRELEVLRLIAKGDSNREIAQRLNISLHTVKNHVHHILSKLKVRNRREAVEAAIAARLLSAG